MSFLIFLGSVYLFCLMLIVVVGSYMGMFNFELILFCFGGIEMLFAV